MKAQCILIVLFVSLGLLAALGVCLIAPASVAAQLAAVETPIPDEVSGFRERLGLNALNGRAASWAAISKTLPSGSITLSETIAARRARAAPLIGIACALCWRAARFPNRNCGRPPGSNRRCRKPL